MGYKLRGGDGDLQGSALSEGEGDLREVVQ